VPRRLLSIARTLRDDQALAEQICQACVDGLDHRRGCDLGGYAARRKSRRWLTRCWMADMTTGPSGEELAYDDRLAEILARYEPDSIVGRSMRRAEPAIRAAIDRTRQRMADAYTI
jgi:hypothetical protein